MSEDGNGVTRRSTAASAAAASRSREVEACATLAEEWANDDPNLRDAVACYETGGIDAAVVFVCARISDAIRSRPPSAAVERPSRREDVKRDVALPWAKWSDEQRRIVAHLCDEQARICFEVGADRGLEAWISLRDAILDRSRLNHAAASEGASPEAVIPTPKSPPPSEVEDLVARQRTRLAELAEFAEIPKALFKEVVDLQLELAHALHSLSQRAQKLEGALMQETEACAKVADAMAEPKPLTGLTNGTWQRAQIDAAQQLARAIRARTALHGSEDAE